TDLSSGGATETERTTIDWPVSQKERTSMNVEPAIAGMRVGGGAPEADSCGVRSLGGQRHLN
ncbi:hypothetical protein GWI33_008791, partial [Rhynchophorus ferrugineus]